MDDKPAHNPNFQSDRIARRSTRGVLLVDGDHHLAILFVRDPSDGAFVLRQPRAELPRSTETTLMLPDDSHECEVAVHLGLGEIPISGDRPTNLADEITQDRYFAYHETRGQGVWIRAHALGAKLSDSTVEPGEALAQPDPLAPAQGSICKHLNADRPALARLCSDRLGIELAEPLVVGADRFGVDVRGAHRVARLEFPEMLTTQDAALAQLDQWLSTGADG